MMTITKRSTKNIILMGILFVLIIITVAVIYKNIFVSKGFSGEFLTEFSNISSSEQYADTLDKIMKQDVINDQRFLMLTPHGGVPITVGEVGKANPFVFTQSK